MRILYKILYFCLAINLEYAYAGEYRRAASSCRFKNMVQPEVGLNGNSIIARVFDRFLTDAEYKRTQKTFERLGVTYSNEVTCQDDSTLALTRQYHEQIMSTIEPNQKTVFAAIGLTKDRFGVMTDNFSKSQDLGLRKDLELKYINPNKGHGVFAVKFMQPDTIIGIYAGEAIHDSRVEDHTYTFNSLHLFEDKRGIVINESHVDALKAGNITRFINAPGCTDTANCYVLSMLDKDKNPQLVFVTTRPIQAGQELTIDYGPKYVWKHTRE